MADFNIDNENKKWATYGNNYFYLRTKVGESNVTMDGVMQELPSINLSSEWEASPAATIGDELEKLANSEFLEFLSQKGGTDGVHMLNSDQTTSRVYKGGSKLSFELKFRCYPGQKVGPYKLRTAKEWIRLLSLTTPVNSNCGINVNNLLNNVGAALDGVVALFKSLKDGDEKEGEDDDNKDEVGETMAKQMEQYKNKDGTLDNSSGAAKLDEAVEGIKDEKDKKDAQAGKVALNAALDGVNGAHAGLTSDSKLSTPRLYGANIFMLRIYPFIFTKEFSVHINSWSVTPSREYNADMGTHYYYDFSLSCEMDQMPSCPTWAQIFGTAKK
jgi:hypothetical protein